MPCSLHVPWGGPCMLPAGGMPTSAARPGRCCRCRGTACAARERGHERDLIVDLQSKDSHQLLSGLSCESGKESRTVPLSAGRLAPAWQPWFGRHLTVQEHWITAAASFQCTFVEGLHCNKSFQCTTRCNGGPCHIKRHIEKQVCQKQSAAQRVAVLRRSSKA